MTLVRAALIGFFTVLFVEVAFAMVYALVASSAGWAGIHLAVGPLEFVRIIAAPGDVSMQLREGVAVLALVAGVLNAFGAHLLTRTSR